MCNTIISGYDIGFVESDSDPEDSIEFEVNTEWLTKIVVEEMGFDSLETFLKEYTWDTTVGLYERAVQEGAIVEDTI